MLKTLDYGGIAAIQDMKNDRQRGVVFEQYIREILPWDERPPLSLVANSEQLDAFFVWKGQHYLVECKAKRGRITRGSHDWEDFQLKVEMRKGFCAGLFCSLFDVSDSCREAAGELCKSGMAVLVLDGSFWKMIGDDPIPFADVLTYMLFHSRAKRAFIEPDVDKIRRWRYDQDEAIRHVRAVCCSSSGTFLRRHSLSNHSELYVPRCVDESIASMLRQLLPASLLVTKKDRQVKGTSERIELDRVSPKQICILRDVSGCGKTMASVQLALSSLDYFGVSRAAYEDDIDAVGHVLSLLGHRYGLDILRAAGKPITYVVDSLDEARFSGNKARQVNSMLRFLDEELNALARLQGLVAFPIAFLFTVREDYWERWRGLFDGRNDVITLSNKFSAFSDAELDLALMKYSKVYHYELSGLLSASARGVLSHPFNMFIFSEANQYRGSVPVSDIVDEHVLARYFTRKREDIVRHQIPGFGSNELMFISAAIAMNMVESGLREATWGDLAALISEQIPLLSTSADEILRAIVSEQLLVRYMGNEFLLAFRHTRFLEYLTAYHMVYRVSRDNSVATLDQLTNRVFESSMVSMHAVHHFILHIC